ncbi:MAG: transglycosylase domain-containing protein [Lachnospiraceae bacterium]|nr:transglycosylase domain-containing protein [Lachnospiraceae bacterium]
MGQALAAQEGLKKKKRKKRRGLRVLGFLFLFFFLALTVTGLFFYAKYGRWVLSFYYKAKSIMREASREDFKRSQTSIIYANDGTVIKTLQSGKEVYYLSYKDIPEAVITAMIVTEDKKFFYHEGVDYLANLRAAYSLVKHKGTIYQGGSTITQQLARNIYLSAEQTYERKITEIFLAAELEKRYKKQEILEFYLNNIYFANGYYGIQAAAHGYFSRGVAELSLSELMFLCAIPNNPSLYDPYRNFEDTLERRDSVMEQMYQDGKLSKEDYMAACAEEIVLCPQEEEYNDYVETFAIFCATRALMEENGFPFCYQFADDAAKDVYLKYYEESYAYWQQRLYHGGYRIYTSIDLKKQELLLETVQNQLAEFDEKTEEGIYTLQGAATCVENETGRVVAIVGGRGEVEYGYSLNRAYQSFRQPGSSIKPLIVYTPWLERGYFPDTIVVDERFSGGPRNANGVYSGKITLRRAVEVSKNTVAWKLFEELTPEVGLSYVTKMQFRNIVPSDYVPAASLGGLTYGVCTLEMAGAYCTLANDGIYRNPTCIIKITTADGEEIVGRQREEVRIYEENAVRMMTDILQGVMTNGTGVKLQLKNSVSAGKTGTTNDIKDGWFVGYTPYYTTAVWVGYDLPKALDNLAGNTYPGYIWQTFMDELHKGLERREFVLYEDDRPVVIPDDSQKEQQDAAVWAPTAPDTEMPEDGTLSGDNLSGDDLHGNDISGTTPDESGNKTDGEDEDSDGGKENPGEETKETAGGDGETAPLPEPTPSTGWIEYDDAWWQERQGGLPEYNDFYE